MCVFDQACVCVYVIYVYVCVFVSMFLYLYFKIITFNCVLMLCFKLMLNDIKAAIRVVSSDDAVLEVTPEVLQALIPKHPSEPEDSVIPIIPAENIAVTADEKKIIRSLRSFSGGCCGGIDGLRPAHLLDLVAVSTAEAGLHLRRSITNLTNKILRVDVSDYAVKLLFSSNLTALKKKDGGIRPVAVGNVFRRLAAKVGCYAVSRTVSHELIIIMVIFKCYFSGEQIALSIKNNNNGVNIELGKTSRIKALCMMQINT